ncbi:unnamed protein product [Rhizophagus irregularis]|nr:unnamed protein product [Rhizophagus irregularis]
MAFFRCLGVWKIWWIHGKFVFEYLDAASGSLDADYDGSPTLWMCEWCSFRGFLYSGPVLGRVKSWNFDSQFF